MKNVFVLFLIMLLPSLVRAQITQEEIGDFRCFYGDNAHQTIYSVSYKGFKGEQGGTDGDYVGRVSPSYEYIIEKTAKGNIKSWCLAFTGRCSRKAGFTMKKGGKILIKLFDESVITLVVRSVDITEDYEYGTWFTPSAKLSEANFNKITQIGVKKIRFETYPKVFDVNYETDIIGVFLKDASKIIKEKINNKEDRLTKGF